MFINNQHKVPVVAFHIGVLLINIGAKLNKTTGLRPKLGYLFRRKIILFCPGKASRSMKLTHFFKIFLARSARSVCDSLFYLFIYF